MNLKASRPRFKQMLVGVAMTALVPAMARGGQACIPACTDTACTTSVCNSSTGQCVSTNKPDSTPCSDTDQNACTTAGCEMGQCVQTHLTTICTPDTNECTDDLACNPATGLCEHPNKPDSTPCSDTDQNACTSAGCEMGQCVQTHVTTPCPPDTNECTNDLACDPQTGVCPHPPKPDSTPCDDTDQNLCTIAGCEVGQCVQTHIIIAGCQPVSTATSTVAATATVTATPTATPTNTPVPNGGECTASGQCESGNCVDAVCCDTPCQGAFERCILPGHVGTCTSTAAGVPATSAGGLIVGALLLGSIAGLGIARRRGRTQRR